MSWHTINGTFRAVCAAPLVLALTLLAGCGAHFDAMQAEPIALNTGAGTKSIIVVSTLHNSFHAKNIGITVFGNTMEEADITAWNVNGHVARVASAHLGQRANVREVFAPGGFDNLGPQHVFADRVGREAEVVKGLVGNQPSDLVVVVFANTYQLSNSNQVIRGLGITRTNTLLNPRTWLHALFGIGVYDGRTYKLVSMKHLYEDFGGFADIRGPHRVVERSWWPASIGAVASDARLKSGILDLISEYLPKLLDKALMTSTSRPSPPAAAKATSQNL